jgi:hypothetical protein
MAHPHSLPLYVLAGALLCSTASMAQNQVAAARITTDVDESSLTTLKGNVPHLARAEYDQGEASPSTQLTHVRLVLSRSSEQQAALDKYLAELQDKSSPNYHKWLTPEQFGMLYGPADSDVAAIVAWLESHGLKLETVSTGRTNIAFSGTVSQVEGAFHASIHSFAANGQQFYSNTTDPKIPSALATVVKGVAHLNTIKPKPQYIPGKMGKYDPSTGRMQPVTSSTSGARPNFTYEDQYGYQNLYTVPGDAATIYDTPNSTLNLNYSSSSTNYTGSGVTIGIGGDSAIQTQYVTAYRSLFLGNSTAPTITNVDGVGDVSGDDTEAYLDTEISGGLAPGATIHLYISSDLNSAIEKAISDNTVDIFSLSFGECELGLSTSDNAQINGWWEQAASQGIAVTVSTGDSGSAGCDDPNSVTVATTGLQVSGFASTPYNIAVGGTDYYPLLNSFSTYVTPATSKSSTTGSSSTYYRTALSYIPESAWNDSTEYDTTISADVPWTGSYSSDANIWAGSGGASNCSTNTSVDKANGTVTNGTCTSGYSKPAWQRGTGVPADGVRDQPDVSLLAADGFQYGALWLMCEPYTYQGANYQECIKQSDSSWYFGGVGGTSAAAPAFAGILALVQQKTGSRLGQAAANLYDLYNGTHSSSIFHDVTVGNIAVSCTSGTANCSKNSAGYYFESGYNTATGYDLATGLGSVDVAQLLTYWGTATGSATTTVNITPSSTTVTSTQSLTVTVSVTGSSGTPTGTVTLSGGGYTSAVATLSSGSYTFTIPANSLSGGTVTLTVSYSGDSVYAANTGSATVTVARGSFTLSATNLSFTAGATSGNASTVTVSAVNGYTGTVTLTAAVTSSPSGAVSTPTLTISNSPVTLSSTTTTGTGTVTVSTTAATALNRPGDHFKGTGWFTAAGGTAIAALLFFFLPLPSRRWRQMLSAVLLAVAVSFAVVGCGGGGGGGGGTTTTKTTPTVTVTPAKATISVTDTLLVAVSVASTGSTPTGSVTLTGGGYTSTAQSLSGGATSILIPVNSLATGTDTLTVTYGGDTNFNSASGSATVTVNKAVTTTGAYTVTVTGTGNDAATTTATTTFTVTVH